ncbi:hypothetical protein ACT9XH_09400 [Methanococcoides methylutens]|uniref:hypothetical protein n=1 Tax=Methanococcoides methylutens TaxID=2226 RepID=UPI004044249C
MWDIIFGIGKNTIDTMMEHIIEPIGGLMGRSIAWNIIIYAIPIGLLIYYGNTTRNRMAATIAGIAMLPLAVIYAYLFGVGADAGHLISLSRVFTRIIQLSPFSIVLGTLGYCAAMRKPAHIIALVIFAFILLTILSID